MVVFGQLRLLHRVRVESVLPGRIVCRCRSSRRRPHRSSVVVGVVTVMRMMRVVTEGRVLRVMVSRRGGRHGNVMVTCRQNGRHVGVAQLLLNVMVHRSAVVRLLIMVMGTLLVVSRRRL